jgi:hypothetical protein
MRRPREAAAGSNATGRNGSRYAAFLQRRTRAMDTRPARARVGSIPAAVWGATVVFGFVLVLWTMLAPAYRSPDESQHVNSVLRLAEGGGWPEPGDARMSGEVLHSRTLAGFTNSDRQGGNWDGGNLLPGVRRVLPLSDLKYFALFSKRAPTPADQRLPFDELHVQGKVPQRLDQMTQHPPLYYAVEAGIYTVVDAENWRFDRALALMRLISVAMVVSLPLLAYLTTTRLTGSRKIGSLAAFVPLAIPQLAEIGSSVTNDALVIGLGAAVITMLAYVLTGTRSWPALTALGVLLGLACLTKGTLLPVIPAAALAIFVGVRRSQPETADHPRMGVLVRVAVPLMITFAVGGWWYLVNLLRYGTIVPAGLEFAPLPPGKTAQGLLAFTATFSGKFATSFWGDFGLLELPLPTALIWVLTVLLIMLVTAGLFARFARLDLALLLVFPALTLAYLLYTTYSLHRESGQFPGIQGRYLFGGVVAISAAVACGLGLLGTRSSLLDRWLLPIFAVGAMASATVGAWVAFRGFWVDIGVTDWQGLARLAAWSPWPRWSVASLLVLCVLAGVVVLAGVMFRAVRPRRLVATGDDGSGARHG